MLLFPYILGIGGSIGGEGVTLSARIISAGFGAFSFALKPYYLFVWLLLEGYVILKIGLVAALKKRALEYIVVLGVLLLFGVLVLLVTPDYINQIMTLAPVYSRFGTVRMDIVYIYYEIPAILIGSFILYIVPASEGYGLMKKSLIIGGLGMVLATLIQSKGWDYHSIPMYMYFLLSVVISVLGFLSLLHTENKLTVGWGRVIAYFIGGIVVPMFLLICFNMINWRTNFPDWFYELEDVMTVQAVGGGVSLLSASTYPSFPLLTRNPDINWVGRFNGLWYLSVTQSISNADLKQFEYMFDHQVMGDIMTGKPKLIIFDEQPDKFGMEDKEFSFIEHFSEYPTFKEFMNVYGFLKNISGYHVYVRQ